MLYSGLSTPVRHIQNNVNIGYERWIRLHLTQNEAKTE